MIYLAVLFKDKEHTEFGSKFIEEASYLFRSLDRKPSMLYGRHMEVYAFDVPETHAGRIPRPGRHTASVQNFRQVLKDAKGMLVQTV